MTTEHNPYRSLNGQGFYETAQRLAELKDTQPELYQRELLKLYEAALFAMTWGTDNNAKLARNILIGLGKGAER